MKKLASILVCLFILCVFILRADNEKPIQVNQLPVAAQQFIKQHFADRKVALAKVETEFVSKSYEVVFADGDHIDFDSKGNWEEIECKSSSVPTAVIPIKTWSISTRIIPIRPSGKLRRTVGNMKLNYPIAWNSLLI